MKNSIIILYSFLLCSFMGTIYTDSITSLIDASGTYIYGGNITANPTDSNDAIITVSASNVIVDLGEHVITQQSGNFVLLHGIIVLPNLNNITIRNGTILNITGSGIFINSGCSNVIIENITTVSCDRVGIELFGTTANPISKITIDNCQTFSCGKFSAASSFAAFNLFNCSQCAMSNCLLASNLNSSFFSALHLENCTDSQFSDIQIKGNSGALGLSGLAMINGSNNIFERCRVIANSSAGFLCWAFLFSGSFQRNVFIDCIALQNTCAAQSIGFLTNGTQSDLLLQGCKSLQNVGGTQSYGFFLQATSIRNNLIDCLAEGNTITNSLTGTAIGFRIENSAECKLFNCIAIDNVAGLGIGVDLLTSTSCIIKGCTASRNVGNLSANSYGFRINNGTTTDLGKNIFIENQALSNGGTSGNQMNNFITGTFLNLSYSLLNTVTTPFVNLGIIA